LTDKLTGGDKTRPGGLGFETSLEIFLTFPPAEHTQKKEKKRKKKKTLPFPQQKGK
jgi:hypothetical protein